MFVDTATVRVGAGKGGDGAVSFRHEIYVDRGGPDGGNGGRGGDVIFKATENLNTLLDFRYKPELKAQNGQNGSKQKKQGRSGQNLYVKVPVGTVVRRDGEIIADFTQNDQEAVIARGGDGGFGNAHFKSSVRQTPKIAELGEPGDSFEADLELKLLADVGLIGFPNAGKSTFLSVVSNARPEIADYAFTTLTPNLGMARVGDKGLLIADIPGLIEGASQGKGLGDAFLRHVERTSVLLHLIDAYSNHADKDYQTIRRELKNYSTNLSERPEVIALTKTEGLDQDIVDMQIDLIKKVAAPQTPIFAISSLAQTGTKQVLSTLYKMVQQQKQTLVDNKEEDDTSATISMSDDQKQLAWQATKQLNQANQEIFVVTGRKIEKFAQRTDFSNFEGVNRLRDIMQKMGITHQLIRLGAQNDSLIKINDQEFTLLEQ